MYFRCASSLPIQKSISVCGLLCVILIVRLTSTAADSLSTHPVILPHCSAPTLQESFLQETVPGFCKSSTQECPSKHYYVASEHTQSTRVAEVIYHVHVYIYLRHLRLSISSLLEEPVRLRFA